MPLTPEELEKRTFELQKLEFEKSLELRNFEISNYWKRGWFFGALLLAIASGYIELVKSDSYTSYCIYLAFLGFLVSLFQGWMNRGSKYWQERWENKTKHLESILGIDLTKTTRFNKNEKYYLDASTLAKNENILTRANRYSVSKLTFLIWDLITIMWLFVWLRECYHHLFLKPLVFITNNSVWLVQVSILLYIFFFFYYKKVRWKKIIKIYNGIPYWVRYIPEKVCLFISWVLHILFWIPSIFFEFKDGGGGKVYEQFLTEKDSDSHRKNTIEPFYTDSENYTNGKIIEDN